MSVLACTPFGTPCIPGANVMTLVAYIRNTLLGPRRHRMCLNESYISCVCLEMAMVGYASVVIVYSPYSVVYISRFLY